MKNIIIDSSILRKDRSLNKHDILLMRKLCKLGLVKLHFPWVIYKEATSQSIYDIKNDLKKAKALINSCKGKGISEEEFESVNSVISSIEKIEEQVGNSVHGNWMKMVDSENIILHDFHAEDGDSVMSAYFNGGIPFSSLKNRKDIPDSFIFFAIKRIQKKYGDVIFICEDNNLRESAIHNISNCQGFSSFDELNESESWMKIYGEYKKIEKFSDGIKTIIENQKVIKEKIEEEIYGDMFAGENQVLYVREEWYDMEEVGLQDIDKVKIEGISSSNIQFIDGQYYLNLDIKANFLIDSFISKSEYYLNEKEKEYTVLDYDWNEYVVRIEQWRIVEFNLVVRINQESIDSGTFSISYDDFDTNDVKFLDM